MILVSWTDVPDTDQNGVITMYEVMYEPLMTFGGVLNTITVNATNLSLTVSELEEYVEYNISVRAYTNDGAGPYSVGTVVRTLENGERYDYIVPMCTLVFTDFSLLESLLQFLLVLLRM